MKNGSFRAAIWVCKTEKSWSDDALASLDAEFEVLYTDFGRPSIPPERLIRASLLQILFSVRSERQMMEQMDYNLMFRWFVGLGVDDPVWVPTVFTKNRDRLLTTEMSRKGTSIFHPVSPRTGKTPSDRVIRLNTQAV